MIISILGPPGSGKGTVAEQLCQEYSFFSLSPGRLLREEVKQGTTLGKNIKKYIESGDLVPDQFVVELVRLTIKGKKKVILDGFPRTVGQAKAIEDLKLNQVIYLDVPENIVIERFAERRVCKEQGHGYHLKYLPPKKKGICDKDGSKLIQRKDDKPEIVKERFKIFHAESEPVIKYYKKKKILCIVDGNKNPEEVYQEAKKILK